VIPQSLEKMDLEKKFKEHYSFKNLANKSRNSYLVYIRKLEEELKKYKKVDDNILISEMNKLISHYNSTQGGGVVCRNAFAKLLKILEKRELRDKLEKGKKRERRIAKKFLSFQQIKVIIDRCKDEELKLIMMIQYETCSRVGDMLKLNVENIDFDENLVRFVEEKTGKLRVCAITNRLASLLKKYLKKKKIISGRIFKMTYWTLWWKQKELLEKLFPYIGEESFIFTSHWLRASRAVHLYQSGIDIETIKRVGGWKNTEVLMMYLRMAGLDTKEVLRKVEPKW